MGCSHPNTFIYSVSEDTKKFVNKPSTNLERANHQFRSSDNQNLSKYPGTNNYLNPKISSWEEEMEVYKDKTVINQILDMCTNHPNYEGLGYRKPLNEKECERNFTFFKFSEIKNLAENLSKNLILNNLCPSNNFNDDGKFQFLGIFARNCFEWIISDLACQMNKITSVTFYATLGDIAFEYISQQTKLSTICISPDSIGNLISYIKKYNIKTIKNVILYDFTLYVDQKHLSDLNEIGVKIILFSDLIKKTEQHNQISLNISEPETIVTLCYTSGTTGIPKGAKLSQNNLASCLLSIFKSANIFYGNTETCLIYLPLAHIMERLNVLSTLIYGCRTGFLSGDVRTSLQEDFEILKPTIVIAVPRVLQLFRSKILDTIDKLPNGCKKNIALKALNTKRQAFRNDNSKISHFLYDKLVFKKIKQKFGGKIKCFVTGSAPLTEEVATDIKLIFSCPIIEGYGLTECCGGLTVSNIADTTNSNVGGPLRNCKVKLVDVPEMKYDSKTLLDGEASPTGEICLWGPTVFKGYFQNPTATNEAIDDEGWFHTGDIGRILPFSRALKIIDRKKEIFKLAQGEYIAPSKLESVYSKSKYIANICVYGNSTKTFLVAIVVPNKESLKDFLDKKGKHIKEINDVVNYYTDKELITEMKADLDMLAKQSNFNSLEKIHKLYLSPKEFTIQNGCLTATLKLARNFIIKDFEREITAMYSDDR